MDKDVAKALKDLQDELKALEKAVSTNAETLDWDNKAITNHKDVLDELQVVVNGVEANYGRRIDELEKEVLQQESQISHLQDLVKRVAALEKDKK
jgi:uncharacterized coiled-coil protein SlyX